MKVLLAGGSGLIGQELGLELVRRGHQVVVTSRRPATVADESSFPCGVVAWRGAGTPLVLEDAATYDGVINLTGQSILVRSWKSHDAVLRASRIDATHDLQAPFVAAGRWPKVWINASAIGIYGDRGDERLDETAEVGLGYLADLCRDWEAAASQAKCRIVTMRTGFVLAKRGGGLQQMLPVFRRGLGGKVASGKQWMSWIHLTDLVQLFATALENSSYQGAVNAVAPGAVDNFAFTASLGRALEKPAVLPVPKMAVLLAMGDAGRLALMSQRCVPAVALRHGFSFQFADIDAALKNLIDFEKDPGMHELFAQQWVPRARAEVFKYFCDEKNLEEMTPSWLNFKVLDKSTPALMPGTLINYSLKIRGVPQRWCTRIESWRADEEFVDTQLKGPYKVWHHTHGFCDLPENKGDGVLQQGTLMTDRVLYKLPLWPLGEAALFLVKQDVSKIFAHRRQVIKALWR